MSKKRIGELLIDLGLVSRAQLEGALQRQQQMGRRLGETLVELGLINEQQLVKVLSRQLNMPAVDLARRKLDRGTLKGLDEWFCRENECLPFAFHETGKFLDVAMGNPLNLELFEQVRTTTRCNPRPYVVGPTMLRQALDRLFGTGPDDWAPPVAADARDSMPSIDIEFEEHSRSLSLATPRELGELRRDLEGLRQVQQETDRRLQQLITRLTEQGVLKDDPD